MKVTVLGTEYEVTEGPFGEMMVNGMDFDDFYDTLDESTQLAMTLAGYFKIIEDPETIKDFIEYYEVPVTVDAVLDLRNFL